MVRGGKKVNIISMCEDKKKYGKYEIIIFTNIFGELVNCK